MKMFYDTKRLAEPHKSLEFMSQHRHWFYKFMNNSSTKKSTNL